MSSEPDRQIDAIVQARHGDPFSILGMHASDGGLVVRSFQPQAEAVDIVECKSGRVVGSLARVHPDGLFEGRIARRSKPFPYRLRIETSGGVLEVDDPYRFPPVLTDQDLPVLADGAGLAAAKSYRRLGAHPRVLDGVEGTAFAVWAPNAKRVSVVGDFNDWDGRRYPMRLRHDNGFWEIFLPGIAAGARYKYEIVGPDGAVMPLRADPYAFYAEQPPRTASVVHGLPDRKWGDGDWMGRRGAAQSRSAPVSIYEVHLGSWRRVTSEGLRYLTYGELADQLIPYVTDMGFTHIELLPISEFPFDGSWGYQPVGLFAPTSRFGDPTEFQDFVERCHAAGIGVLLDWVPGHFPTDPHGLGFFDGTHLYEHADPRQGFHMDWNTLIYNYGRAEIANFLVDNAIYWMDQFHLDGIRVDAVASMLYLDYSRKPGQWVPNRYGGRENLEAIDFLKRMNEAVYGDFPGAMTVAEESTAWPGVSRPTDAGGLGFGFKWNMGWMNDSLRYISKEPVHRRFHQNDLTFGLLYGFSENFVLPISHDEVVHGKGSMIGKMPGDEWRKFANLRAYYAFMWTHPGKKLLFMGCEFAQWREWDHNSGLDWHLLQQPAHAGVQSLIRDLNRIYRDCPALHRLDCEAAGFEWIDNQDAANSVLAYLRKGYEDDPPIAIICNFTPEPRLGYRVGVPEGGDWVELINTDAADYGGSGIGNLGTITAEAVPSHGRPFSLDLSLPPLGVVILQARRRSS